MMHTIANHERCVFQSFPQDLHKIKTLLGGVLYAYELPPLPPIPTMSVEEERAMASLPRVQCGLSQMQRISREYASRVLMVIA